MTDSGIPEYIPLGHFWNAMSTDLHAIASIGCTGWRRVTPTSRGPVGFPDCRSSEILSRTFSMFRELLKASCASLCNASRMCLAPAYGKINNLELSDISFLLHQVEV